MNPGPHGPEIYAVSSTEIDFEGFEIRNWSGARDLNPGPHGPEI